MKFANEVCKLKPLWMDTTKPLHDVWKCSPSVNYTTTRCRIPNQFFSYSVVSSYNHSYCNKEVWNILYQSTPHQEAYTLGLLNFAQDKILLYSWSNSWMQDSILAKFWPNRPSQHMDLPSCMSAFYSKVMWCWICTCAVSMTYCSGNVYQHELTQTELPILEKVYSYIFFPYPAL